MAAQNQLMHGLKRRYGKTLGELSRGDTHGEAARTGLVGLVRRSDELGARKIVAYVLAVDTCPLVKDGCSVISFHGFRVDAHSGAGSYCDNRAEHPIVMHH